MGSAEIRVPILSLFDLKLSEKTCSDLVPGDVGDGEVTLLQPGRPPVHHQPRPPQVDSEPSSRAPGASCSNSSDCPDLPRGGVAVPASSEGDSLSCELSAEGEVLYVKRHAGQTDGQPGPDGEARQVTPLLHTLPGRTDLQLRLTVGPGLVTQTDNRTSSHDSLSPRL